MDLYRPSSTQRSASRRRRHLETGMKLGTTHPININRSQRRTSEWKSRKGCRTMWTYGRTEGWKDKWRKKIKNKMKQCSFRFWAISAQNFRNIVDFMRILKKTNPRFWENSLGISKKFFSGCRGKSFRDSTDNLFEITRQFDRNIVYEIYFLMKFSYFLSSRTFILSTFCPQTVQCTHAGFTRVTWCFFFYSPSWSGPLAKTMLLLGVRSAAAVSVVHAH